jgi:hypothetical protein
MENRRAPGPRGIRLLRPSKVSAELHAKEIPFEVSKWTSAGEQARINLKGRRRADNDLGKQRMTRI